MKCSTGARLNSRLATIESERVKRKTRVSMVGGVRLIARIGIGHPAHQRGGHNWSKSESRPCACHAQQATLDEQLGDDAGAFGAEREAHGHFARSARGSQE